MKKKKDGTVIASLTEVKNKTGDIFALADEYGEVLLTSYNKPRYKIVKLDISTMLDEIAEEPAKVVQSTVKQNTSTVSQPKQVTVVPVAQTIVTKVQPAMIDKLITLAAWDRNNSKETSFAARATKGLLN